jgi:hypothetical protein
MTVVGHPGGKRLQVLEGGGNLISEYFRNGRS